MNRLKMIWILRQALKDNESALLMERRSVGQVELLSARMEILKSICHQQEMLIAELTQVEYKEAA